MYLKMCLLIYSQYGMPSCMYIIYVYLKCVYTYR